MRIRQAPDTTIDVLIAEDDAITRLTVRRVLEGEGYQCAEAADGEEALQIARHGPPRLVLLDVMMPVLDGFRVAQQLRSERRTRDVPILFLTARNDRAARVAARRAGCQAVVAKPVDFDGLLDLVSTALNCNCEGH